MLDLGLNKAKVAKVVSVSPQVLGYSIEHNLKPSVQWMLDLGLKKAHVAKIISVFPQVLGCSVQDNLKPTVQWMLDLGLNKAQVNKAISVFPQLLGCSVEKNLKVKWDLLRCFLCNHSVLEVVASFPPIFGYKLDRLRSRIECLDDQGKIQKLASAMSLSQADFDRRFGAACPKTSVHTVTELFVSYRGAFLLILFSQSLVLRTFSDQMPDIAR
jgi:mTERF domain-containing protein